MNTEAYKKTDKAPGGLAINPPVFYTSALLIILFSIYGTLFTAHAEQVFSAVQAYLTGSFGWLYMSSVAIFVIFVIGLALSSYGLVKLGPDDSEPDYSYMTWFAMLFSAGMGIGLMFFGVAEPVMHFLNPPVGQGSTVAAARESMITTFFHWGLHAWAIYIVTGLALAYFSFRHGLPLTIRSALYPILGERIHGPIGHAVDIFAVLGTMFGVATSLGLGVMQVNAGINYLFDTGVSIGIQIILITVITVLATGSVVTGLDKGIRRISELNLLLALVLLLFVLVTGPTVFLMNAVFQNLGGYLSNLANMTFKLYAYEPNSWISSWTLFYWGWWISWSPFVGMFIARVSRGRTIREFVTGVLFVPTGFTFLWLTVFGNTALNSALLDQSSTIVMMVQDNLPVALFALLDGLPWSALMSLLATILVITFFVTSSDSGSLVIDMLTSGGRDDTAVWQRVFWAIAEGVVAAVLLLAGGLAALQTAAITSALPFAIIMLFMCYGLLRGLQISHSGLHVPGGLPALSPFAVSQRGGGSWQQRLRNLFTYHSREQVLQFLQDSVQPALTRAANEFAEQDLQAEVTSGDDRVSFTVTHDGHEDFVYTVRLRSYRMPSFAFPEFSMRRDQERYYYQAEVDIDGRREERDLTGSSQDEIIHDMLGFYETHMQLLQPHHERPYK